MAKKENQSNAVALKQKPALERGPQKGAERRKSGNDGKQRITDAANDAVRLWKVRQEKRALIPSWRLRPEDDLPIDRKRKQVSKKRARARELDYIVQEGLRGHETYLETIDILRSSGETGAIRSLPRRKTAKGQQEPYATPPVFKDQQFEASLLQTLLRCAVWLKVILAFQLGVLWDKIRKQNTIERRAVRFYKIFQSAGGSFAKIGQQLAMRIDLLPHEYCEELSKLLDSVTPFPSEQAIALIEKATRKPIDETFAAFDPKPIGSATIACVYQAILKNGDKVAVKVRRPNIGPVFAADLRAMRWMVSVLEMFALIRKGYLDHFISEFSATILEELDFRMEAYHQSMFRREAKKNKFGRMKHFTAPKVYYQYSNQEILVQEFVSGIWMWEILAAVEHNDEVALARMHQLNIWPKEVAKTLYWVSLWSQLVAPMFHADPHPANIVVQKNNKLVFIDFGACGALSLGKRKLAQELITAHARKDVGAVVRCCVAFMEPLPPVDLHNVLKELEVSFSGALHRMWSKHAPWYEKSSAAFYVRLFGVTRKYNIPVNLDTVRAFRANMLYDTLVVRIDPKLEPVDHMQEFLKDCDKALSRGAAKSLRKRLSEGLFTGRDVSTFNDVRDISERMLAMARRLLDRPQFSLNYMVEKSVFAVIESVSLVFRLIALTILGLAIIVLYKRIHDNTAFADISIRDAMFELPKRPTYIILAILPTLVSLRRIMMRLNDNET